MHQLQRSNQLLEGEVATMKVQLAAKDKALEDAHSEIHLANSRLDNTEATDRKQQKIDNMTTEVLIVVEDNNVCLIVFRHSWQYFSHMTVFQLGQNRRALRPSCTPWRPSCPPLRPSALPCALLAPLMPPIDFCSSMAVSGTTIY